MTIRYRPIGTIHTPFNSRAGMPIQPRSDTAATGTVEVLPAYAEGLEDLEEFSHLILIYHFHRAGEVRLTVTPFLDDRPHGVFATRAPNRPNPIGLSIVQLVHREANILHVTNVDIVDGTPLLDIKPYVPAFDRPADVRSGWLEDNQKKVQETESDERFC